jgi:hypothetical protein
VGLRGRIPLAPHELGVTVAYGHRQFDVTGDADPAPQQFGLGRPSRDLVPDVGYSYVRPGVDARFRFLDFIAGLYAGYRGVLSVGDIGSSRWFPKATASGFDVGLFGGYGVAKDLSVILGGDLEMYAVNLHARAGDLPGAGTSGGTATDRYLSGYLGLSWQPTFAR